MTHFLRPHTSSGKRHEPPHGSALLARQNCRWEAMHVADEMNFPPQESLTPRNTLQGKTSDAWWFEVRNFKALTRRHSRRQSEASAPAALLDRMFSSVLNHIYIPVITLLSFCAVVWSSRRWNTNSELLIYECPFFFLLESSRQPQINILFYHQHLQKLTGWFWTRVGEYRICWIINRLFSFHACFSFLNTAQIISTRAPLTSFSLGLSAASHDPHQLINLTSSSSTHSLSTLSHKWSFYWERKTMICDQDEVSKWTLSWDSFTGSLKLNYYDNYLDKDSKWFLGWEF